MYLWYIIIRLLSKFIVIVSPYHQPGTSSSDYSVSLLLSHHQPGTSSSDYSVSLLLSYHQPGTSSSDYSVSLLLSYACNVCSSAKSKAGEKHMSSLPSTPMQPVSAFISSSGSMATTVVYFLCDEPIPYSTKVNNQAITLAQFKELVAKKGSYR